MPKEKKLDIKLKPLKIELEDFKVELEDAPEIKISDLTIKDTMKKSEVLELLGGLIRSYGLVFEVADKKIIEEGLRKKKDKETIQMLKKYDEVRKKFNQATREDKKIEGK